jgi:hypothetical protein
MLLRPQLPAKPGLLTRIGRGGARVIQLAENTKKKCQEILLGRLPKDHPLPELIDALETASTVTIDGVQKARETIGTTMDTFDPPLPPSIGDHRRSGINVRTLLCLTLMAAGTVKVAHDIQPVEQPRVVEPGTYLPAATDGEFSLPSPDEPIESIMMQLRTPQMVEAFLAKNVKYEFVSFPKGFVRTFRRSPEEFLKNGEGPCNNYGEFVGEWAASRGMQSYIHALRPKGIDMVRHPWHQITVLCVRKNQAYLIFDNGSLIEHRGTLEEFHQKHYKEMVTIHYAPWYRCSPTFIGGMSMHGRPGVSEDEMTEYPELEMHMRAPQQIARNLSRPEAKNAVPIPNMIASVLARH